MSFNNLLIAPAALLLAGYLVPAAMLLCTCFNAVNRMTWHRSSAVCLVQNWESFHIPVNGLFEVGTPIEA